MDGENAEAAAAPADNDDDEGYDYIDEDDVAKRMKIKGRIRHKIMRCGIFAVDRKIN